MKRIIRLTEKDLAKIVKRILKEDNDPRAPEMPEIPPQEYLDLIASADTEKEMGDDIVTQQVTEYWNKSNNLSRLVRRVISEEQMSQQKLKMGESSIGKCFNKSKYPELYKVSKGYSSTLYGLLLMYMGINSGIIQTVYGVVYNEDEFKYDNLEKNTLKTFNSGKKSASGGLDDLYNSNYSKISGELSNLKNCVYNGIF
jgi:hypothetical protein